MKNSKIILASSSPRRIEMMRAYEIEPVIIPPLCDETLPTNMDVETSAMYLSLKKSLWVENYIKENPIDKYSSSMPYIIAADTVVFKDFIIGKPENQEDAYRILSHLKGDMHYVITGVTILQAHTARRRTFYEKTGVFFKDYSKKELMEYISTNEPYDKAGGYAIQGTFGKYVDHIQGDLNNVIGFPWDKIVSEFNALA